MALIQLEQVSKIYNPGTTQVVALDRISLSVAEGEFMAIVGQSGSGKSTLMNILGCLDIPTRGSYCLEGQDISHLPDRVLSIIRSRKIGFVFQGFNLIPSLTARENVELPLIYRGMPREARHQMAEEALMQVGLADRMQHRPAEMSGGQQQRVAIARAIAANPPILLADEPTGNLDSRSGQEILSILQSLNRKGHTILLITHDAAIAACASRKIRIHDGKIEEEKQQVG